MELTYKVNKTDFLNYHLYVASQSERIKRTRLRSRLIVLAAFISLAYLFYAKHDSVLMWYFLLLAIAALLFYPYYQRGVYKRHYLKGIDENYKARIDKPFVLRIEEDKLWSKDELSETTISLASISEIVEVPSAFYIRTPGGGALLLPKQQLADASEIRAKLQAVAVRFMLPYKQELAWVWK